MSASHTYDFSSIASEWDKQSGQEQVPITGVSAELRAAQTVLARHKAYRQRNEKADAVKPPNDGRRAEGVGTMERDSISERPDTLS